MTKLTNLHFFLYSIFWCQEPTVYWETSRSDTDRSRISETDKIIISWHWWELCLQMVLFFCPFYLNGKLFTYSNELYSHEQKLIKIRNKFLIIFIFSAENIDLRISEFKNYACIIVLNVFWIKMGELAHTRTDLLKLRGDRQEFLPPAQTRILPKHVLR